MVIDLGPVPTALSKNVDIIKYLQACGIEVNPNAKKSDLLAQVAKIYKKNEDVVKDEVKPLSDVQQMMAMMSTMVSKLDSIDKRVTSVETGGKGDFKLSVKQADVERASENKKHIDERIVKIVEDVLGIDFGLQIEPNPNGPGFQFSVLVPERLSEVKRSTRPIRDEVTGDYKLDEKKRVMEEEYWPGDKRSRAIGSTDSFDVVRDHCNRVRSYIMSYYEKNKKPVPEFRLR